MQIPPVFHYLGLALGLGLLVGLQRERTEARLAGFRTFPLVTVLGTLCALLAESFGGWVLGLGLLAVALTLLSANLMLARADKADPGMTTEVALLVMFATGAYIPGGSSGVAIVIGGSVAVLLHLKPQMHAIAGRIGEEDFKAIMQFVLITLVILPVLPNKTFGPFQVLNPYKIWLMVVLIVGISLGGYVVHKIFGERAGSLAAGVLGGLISSTATTVSYARRVRENPASATLGAIVIISASAVVFVRVLVLMGVTAPPLLWRGLGPFLTLLSLLCLVSFVYWWLNRGEKAAASRHGNPSELKSAIFFAFLYAVILLAIAAGKQYFGQEGLWAVAIVSGLTDMDAITLSVAQLVQDGQLAADTGWRLVMAAALSNLVFKAGIVAVSGIAALLKRIAVLFAIAFAAGLAILVWWP